MSLPAVLLVAAAITGAVSAATGMAGGVMLLAVFALTLPAAAVVPMHGAVQLIAGSTRLVVFRRDVDWQFVRRFCLGLVPGSAIGAGVFTLLATLDPNWLQLGLGIAIVASAVAPTSPAPQPAAPGVPPSRFVPLLGLGCGVVGMLVGSTGPLVSRGLLAEGIVKERHIGTKAWAQSIGQLLKLPLFGLAMHFDYGAEAGLLAALGLATGIGTIAGRRLLAKLPERGFVRIANVLLVLVGLQLAIGAVWELV